MKQNLETRSTALPRKCTSSKNRCLLQVEACSNGDWLDGKVIEVNTDSQFYPYFVVKLEDGATEDMPIGTVTHKRTSFQKL